MDKGYIGKIKNTGSQRIEAPNIKKGNIKEPKVKGDNGKDLRANKTEKLSK